MQIADTLIAGKYRVIKKLGEGAMGSVWLATNQVTEREFAIKVLLPSAASEPAGLSRFFREARICGGLRHPSILEIYDAGTAPELDGAPYLVMERLEGAPLDAILRQRGALKPALAVEIVATCARGLHLAHQKGIVHRDLKPANIFLHRPGTGALVPKVLDFGISKVVGTPEIALTQSSTVLGSPLYMSPEQMETRTLDARSDVHALGVVLWECLVGAPPFSSTSYNTLVVEIMRGPRPRLRDVAPSISPELAAIVERAFAMDRSDRHASAETLADDLDAELATLGGGVLAGRTAAVDVLSGLDLSSRPPPPTYSSTTQPLSVDPVSHANAPRSFGDPPREPLSDAFQETVPAPETGPRGAVAVETGPRHEPLPPLAATPALAVSAIEATRSRLARRLLIPVLAAGALVAAAAVALVAAPHAAAPPVAAATAAPLAITEPSPPSLPATPTPAPAAPPTASPAPASVPSASAAQTPAPAPKPAAASVAPVAAQAVASAKPHPAPSAKPPGRPRIDESGL